MTAPQPSPAPETLERLDDGIEDAAGLLRDLADPLFPAPDATTLRERAREAFYALEDTRDKIVKEADFIVYCARGLMAEEENE